MHHAQRDVLELIVPGVTSVACVPPIAFKSPLDASEQARHMQVWKRDLGRQNIQLRLDNVVEPRLMAQALELRVDFYTSARLWPAVANAEGVKPFSTDHVLHALARPADERSSAR